MKEELKKMLEMFKKMSMHTDGTKDLLIKLMEKGSRESCEISITKKEGANTPSEIHVKGSIAGILFNLAGIEKAILKQYDVPEGVLEMIKEHMGMKDVDNE